MSDPDLTLHYHFSKDKTLVAHIGPTLNITRTTVATFVNASGLIESAAAGVARFDHDPVSKTSLGLLVEEARTNLALQSQNFATTWEAEGASIVSNVAVAPDGTTTMDRLDVFGGDKHDAFQAVTVIANVDFTASVFLKSDGVAFAGLTIGTGTDFIAVVMNLSTGAITDTELGSTSGTIIGTRSENFGNGIFRLCITGNINTVAGFIIPFASDSGTPAYSFGRASYIAIEGQDLFMWGAQITQGRFVTSYILTTTIAVARNADIISTSDVTWVSTGVGTLYTESIVNPSIAQFPNSDQTLCSIDDGTTDNSILQSLRVVSGVADVNFFIVATTLQVNFQDDTNIATGINLKYAAAWQTNDFRAVNNGRTAITSNSGSAPTSLNALHVGVNEVGTGNFFNGHIPELRYYDVRKSNDFLDALSNGLISEDDTDVGFASDTAKPLARNIARQL